MGATARKDTAALSVQDADNYGRDRAKKKQPICDGLLEQRSLKVKPFSWLVCF